MAKAADLTHAQCWVHTRRYFFEARHDEPALVDDMPPRIRRLYKIEDEIVEGGLDGDAKRKYRLAHSKPVVDGIVQWVQQQRQTKTFLPSSPFTKALNYLHNRIIGLRVFLTEPDVPLDTNHVERALRPIPMGRNYEKFSIMKSRPSFSLWFGMPQSAEAPGNTSMAGAMCITPSLIPAFHNHSCTTSIHTCI